MRKFAWALLIWTACASNGSYVNVASIRGEIGATISRDAETTHAPSRRIVSMGHTTSDSAIVFTQVTPGSPRRQETWKHGPGGWTLQDAKELGAN